MRSIGRIAIVGLILIVVCATLRVVLPDTFCAVPWPAPIASICSQ
jgi:hypothetical protein